MWVGITVRWALALAIGILLLGTGGELGARFVLSGDLTYQHGDIAECTGCHGVGEHGALGWLVSALRPDSGLDDSGRCLECHRLGDGALLAHSLPAGALKEAEPEGGATPPILPRRPAGARPGGGDLSLV